MKDCRGLILPRHKTSFQEFWEQEKALSNAVSAMGIFFCAPVEISLKFRRHHKNNFENYTLFLKENYGRAIFYRSDTAQRLDV